MKLAKYLADVYVLLFNMTRIEQIGHLNNQTSQRPDVNKRAIDFYGGTLSLGIIFSHLSEKLGIFFNH